MKVKPGMGGKFRKTFEKEVASTSAKLEGLRRLYLLEPVEKSDEFVAVSLWDNQKSAEKYARSGKNKAYADKLADFMEGEERVKKFHVLIHVVGGSASTAD